MQITKEKAFQTLKLSNVSVDPLQTDPVENKEFCQNPLQTMDFEIHVTGHRGELLEAELFSGFPVLGIEALSPSGVGIYTDWMTNIHAKFSTLNEAVEHMVNCIEPRISMLFPTARSKIETSYIAAKEHNLDILYLETHYKVNSLSTPFTQRNGHPVSVNQRTQEYMATSRCYNPKQFERFVDTWGGTKIEACVYDTSPNHDQRWFDAWGLVG